MCLLKQILLQSSHPRKIELFSQFNHRTRDEPLCLLEAAASCRHYYCNKLKTLLAF